MSRIFATLGRGYLALILLFLYVPILVMMIMAFNKSPLYTLPFRFDTIWFEKLAGNEKLLRATWNSVWIGLLNMVIATTLGTMLALVFARYEFRGKRLIQALLLPPLVIPWLITGTAMLIFFFWTGIGRGLHAILLGHVALSLPYVVVVISARLQNYGRVYEEAAESLGASAAQVFLRVTLPLMAPGIVAAALFAFAISFDQFVISYFLAPVGISILPVEIYSSIRQGFTPEVNAISTLVILVSMGLMLAFARFSNFAGERG